MESWLVIPDGRWLTITFPPANCNDDVISSQEIFVRIFPILHGKAWLLGCSRILYIEQVNQGKDVLSSITPFSFNPHLQVKQFKQFTLLLTSYFMSKKASHFNYTMPKTLLTGANGFVAAHIIDQLIAQGHTVTGSIRSPSKGQQILCTHPSYAGKLDFVIVSDYAAP
jgi:hypothetical protein